MDAISYGIIGGLLDLTLAGQAQEKKEAIEKKKKQAEALQKGQDTLVTQLVASPEAANIALSNPAMAAQIMNFDVNTRMAIVTSASKNYQTPSQKSYIERAASDPAIARDLLTNNQVNADPDFLKIRPMIMSLASPMFTKQEMEMMKEVGGDYDKAQAWKSTGLFAENSVGYNYLNGIQQPQATYESVPEGAYTEIKQLFRDEKPADALVLIGSYFNKAKVAAATDGKAFSDFTRLGSLRDSYGSKKTDAGLDDPDYLMSYLQNAVGFLTSNDKVVGEKAQKKFAQTTLERIDALEKMKGKNFKVDTPEELELFNVITSIANTADNVDKNVLTFNDAAKNAVLNVQLDEPFSKNKIEFAYNLNRNYTVDQLKSVYASMDATNKAQFEQYIKEGLGDKFLQSQQTKMVGSVIESQIMPYVPEMLPNLYEAFPFVKTYTHQDLNQPPIDGTLENRPTINARQVQDDQTTPLAPTQIRTQLAVYDLPPAVVSLAERAGTTPQNLILHDSGYAGLMRENEENPFRLFEVANNISPLFSATAGNRAIQPAAAQTVGYMFAQAGVYELADQLDVIAAVMSSKGPQRQFGAAGIPGSVLTKFIQVETGRSIDMDDIGKMIDNRNQFATNLTQAISLMRQQGTGSRLTDGVTSTILNYFGVRGNVFQKAVGGTYAFFASNDFRDADGSTANQQMGRVAARIDSYMTSQDFASRNAQLNSLVVTLAYNYAKTMDPSGRISERDFASALDAVSGALTDNRETTLSVMNMLLDKTRDANLRDEQIFGFATRTSMGSNFYKPTAGEIRQIRALKHFDPIVQATQDMQFVERYQTDLQRLGVNNTDFQDRYYFDDESASFVFGVVVTDEFDLFELKLAPPTSSDRDDMANFKSIMGGIYVRGDGSILTDKEVRYYKSLRNGVQS